MCAAIKDPVTAPEKVRKSLRDALGVDVLNLLIDRT
jgi:hypothetical protein